ncbi:MAG TPA: AAA family ATPase, partial [Kiritimatiellia bacterium]|nr:AAA family ATPase [Kiritimatiellia bacterium]
MAKLFIQQPEGDQLLTELDNTQAYLIGRKEDCSICIPAESISGHHAQLSPSEQGWVLQDLGSSNGTSVNGQAIGQTLLANGAQIMLGEQVVLLFLDESAAAEPALAAEAAAQPGKKEEKKAKKDLKVQGASEEDLKLVKAMSLRSEKIRDEIAKVIIGQVDVIDQVLMVIIAGGHGLLVGMPGMAKTTLCSTIAKVLDMEFKRVQFTPDLMPTDITGTEILEHDPVTDKKSFRFIKGPIFTNMLLADEINRTPPK